MQMGRSQDTTELEARLQAQDAELEALRLDMGRVMKVEKKINSLSEKFTETMGGDPGNGGEEVQEWLKNKVKLPQYFQVFMLQGFDELEAIKDVTKDDLVAMGIDKVGHQRKILKQTELIQ